MRFISEKVTDGLKILTNLDRLRQQQENKTYDPVRPQGLPRPESERCRVAIDAQPDLRC